MAIVWASNAMINPANLRALMYAFPGKDYDGSADIGIPCSRQNNAGVSLDAECFPPEIYVKKDSGASYDKLPDLFFAGSYWVVSGAAADVLRQFDMGDGNLYPVKVFRRDRKTPIGDEWFCLNFGNQKRSFLPDQSWGRSALGPSRTYWLLSDLKDNGLSLTSAALNGPDIWIEAILGDTFFVSDPLAKALKDAGVARAFGLKKCKII